MNDYPHLKMKNDEKAKLFWHLSSNRKGNSNIYKYILKLNLSEICHKTIHLVQQTDHASITSGFKCFHRGIKAQTWLRNKLSYELYINVTGEQKAKINYLMPCEQGNKSHTYCIPNKARMLLMFYGTGLSQSFCNTFLTLPLCEIAFLI